MKTAISIILVGFASCSAALSDDLALSLKVDDNFARPTLRWRPPNDRNGDVPRETLIKFLELVRTNKHEDAASLCYFGWRKGDETAEPKDWKTIEGAEFRMICEALKRHIKEVVISGSTVRQKSGYYSIECKFIDNEGKKTEGRVYFLQIDEVWKVRETSVSAIHSWVSKAK